jgi:hypothetical protein
MASQESTLVYVGNAIGWHFTIQASIPPIGHLEVLTVNRQKPLNC